MGYNEVIIYFGYIDFINECVCWEVVFLVEIENFVLVVSELRIMRKWFILLVLSMNIWMSR